MSETQTSVKKPIGRYLALAFTVMSLLSGLNTRKDGDFSKSDDYFISSVLTIIGIILYTLGKNRKDGKEFAGSKVVEGILFIVILFAFGMGYINTGWTNNPLVWFVVPFWIMVTYLILVLKKGRKVI